jgi:hypothetical protein
MGRDTIRLVTKQHSSHQYKANCISVRATVSHKDTLTPSSDSEVDRYVEIVKLLDDIFVHTVGTKLVQNIGTFLP